MLAADRRHSETRRHIELTHANLTCVSELGAEAQRVVRSMWLQLGLHLMKLHRTALIVLGSEALSITSTVYLSDAIQVYIVA